MSEGVRDFSGRSLGRPPGQLLRELGVADRTPSDQQTAFDIVDDVRPRRAIPPALKKAAAAMSKDHEIGRNLAREGADRGSRITTQHMARRGQAQATKLLQAILDQLVAGGDDVLGRARLRALGQGEALAFRQHAQEPDGRLIATG